MAFKLLTPGGRGGRMNHVWNISKHVGSDTSCPNLPTDVELVNYLLDFHERLGSCPAAAARITNSGITVNATFDVATGFWIYYLQSRGKSPGCKTDGIVSPARGADPLWLIGYLNIIVFQNNPTLFQNLDREPALSPQLRAELSQGRRAP